MKWIPVSYAQFCIENDCTNAGKLFCFLKDGSDGITGRELIRKARVYFDTSDRTVRRWLAEARAYNWIGFNPATGIYLVRSWQYLFDTLRFQKKACYRFNRKDLKDFKTYCYAVVISYMARAQAKKLERSSGRSNQASACVPLAVSAIAKTLKVSDRTAFTFRKNAVDAGYIRKRENLKPFHIKISELGHFRKFSPDADKHHLVVRERYGRLRVFEQLPDLIEVDRESIHSPRRYKTGQNRVSRFSSSVNDQPGTLPPCTPLNSMYAKSVRPYE